MKLKIFKLFCIINFIWYLSRLFSLALNLAPGVGPDEMYHLQVIDLYSRSSSLFPFSNSNSTIPVTLDRFIHFSQLTEYPYLYHLAIGALVRLANVNAFDFNSILSIRLLNIFLAVTNVFIARRLFIEFGSNFLVRNIGVFIITNIPMLTVVSASVSYDNLLYFFSWSSCLYFFRFLKKSSSETFLSLMIFWLLGAITKVSFLPIIIIQLSFLIIYKFNEIKEGRTLLKHYFNFSFNKSKMVFILLLLILNLEFYGGNIYQFGKIQPSCLEIYNSECLNYDNASYEYSKKINTGHNKMTLIEYFPFWIYQGIKTSFGIKSHRSIELPFEFNLIISLIAMFGVFWFFLLPRTTYFKILCAYPTLYLLVLICYVNYPAYLDWGDAESGINGRYSFPVLPPLISMILTPFFTTPCDTKKLIRASLLSLLVFIPQFWILFYSENYRWLISPPNREFYNAIGYFPNPIYDHNYQIIENRSVDPL